MAISNALRLTVQDYSVSAIQGERAGTVVVQRNCRAYLLGSLCFFPPSGEQYRGEGALREFVSHSEQSGALLDTVTHCYGAFILVIEGEQGVWIICSANSPGLYYTRDRQAFRFAVDEFRLPEWMDRGLHVQRLADFLVAMDNVLPFHGLGEGVRRIPGGFTLELQRADGRCRLMPNANLGLADAPLSLGEFTSRFDREIDRLRFYANGRPIVLALSGGIDSAVLLAALVGRSVIPRLVTIDESDPLMRLITTVIARQFGLEVEIIRRSNDIASVADAATRLMVNKAKGRTVVSNGAIYKELVSWLEAEEDLRNPLLISGQNADRLYLGETYFQSSKGRRSATWKQAINNLVNASALHRAVERRGVTGARDFLTRIMASSPTGKLSLVESLNGNALRNNMGSLPDHAMEVRSAEREALEESLTDRGLTLRLHTQVRLAHFARYVASINYQFHGMFHDLPFEVTLPFSSDAMSNYFLSGDTSVLDAIYPKRVLFSYFEQMTGVAYQRLVRSIGPGMAEGAKRSGDAGKWVYGREGMLEVLKIMYRRCDPDAEAFLYEQIDDPSTQRRIAGIAGVLTDEGTNPPSRDELTEVANFVNLLLILTERLEGAEA